MLTTARLPIRIASITATYLAAVMIIAIALAGSFGSAGASTVEDSPAPAVEVVETQVSAVSVVRAP